MTKTDEEIRQEWKEVDGCNIDEICKSLSMHEQRVQDYLADFVCAICNIQKDELFANTSVLHIAQVRWLFWYAYRYMTNEPYAKLAEIFSKNDGQKFSQQTITSGTNKMANMISNNTVWTKRWLMLKRIIKLRDDCNEGQQRILIHLPKELRDKVKIEIKEV